MRRWLGHEEGWISCATCQRLCSMLFAFAPAVVGVFTTMKTVVIASI